MRPPRNRLEKLVDGEERLLGGVGNHADPFRRTFAVSWSKTSLTDTRQARANPRRYRSLAGISPASIRLA
jgi:hypothetical protein